MLAKAILYSPRLRLPQRCLGRSPPLEGVNDVDVQSIRSIRSNRDSCDTLMRVGSPEKPKSSICHRCIQIWIIGAIAATSRNRQDDGKEPCNTNRPHCFLHPHDE